MTSKTKLCILLATGNIFGFLYLLNSCKNWDYHQNSKVVGIRNQNEIDDKFPIIFYHKAYVDKRYFPAKLRVFTLNPCISQQAKVMADLEFRNQKIRSIELSGRPTEGDCPWHWAKECFYNTFIFDSDLNLTEDLSYIDKVTIKLGNRRIELEPTIVENKKKHGLTVCVQPVYWFSSYQNIVLFIEAWLSQGATNFIVYFHSSTPDVLSVLKHYEEKGILRIIPWPQFGSLSPMIDQVFPKADASTYRVGHTLAQNLCVLEMKTDIGTVTDFDEVISARNKTVIQLSKRELSKHKVGALSFPHLLVKLIPKIVDNDYTGTLNPIFLDRSGPTKTVFNTSVVDILSTHSIHAFIGEKYITSIQSTVGALLHYRYNSYTENYREINSTLKFFNSGTLIHLKNINNDLDAIFDGDIPSYDPTIIQSLNECIFKLKEETVCRSTVFYCKSKMESLSKWVYEQKNGVFVA